VKYFLPWILFLALAGCCQVTELPDWPVENNQGMESTLYRFRLEHSTETKFSGLLALKPREEGMWGVLLDATGVPLVKMLVQADGYQQVEYSATALRKSKLPELLGKLIEYIYFTPAGTDCPWYALSRVCIETKDQVQSIKWKKLGPLKLWEVEHSTEMITVHMNLSSISVHLLEIENYKDR
jgi:hypothetical protein